MAKRKSFVIHIDSLDILDDLSDEQAGQLFKAIRSHQVGEEVELSPIVKIAFSPFKNQFGRDDEKYQKLCEKNRLIAEKRYATKSTTGKTGNQTQPAVTKSTDNKSDSDSKNKSDSKSDIKDSLSASADAVSVLTYLNSIFSSKYRHTTKSHIENINARLAEGHTIEDCKAVIDHKFTEWGNDAKMSQYLRPQTLFQTGKFQGYLMAAKAKPTQSKHDLSDIEYQTGSF